MPPMLSASTVSWCSQPPAGEGSSEGRHEPVALENEIALLFLRLLVPSGCGPHTHTYTQVSVWHICPPSEASPPWKGYT